MAWCYTTMADFKVQIELPAGLLSSRKTLVVQTESPHPPNSSHLYRDIH